MMFPGHAASSLSGYGRARGSSILPGNNWDLIENLMARAVNPCGRPIHFSKDSRPEEWCYSWAGSDRMAGELQRPVRVADHPGSRRVQRHWEQSERQHAHSPDYPFVPYVETKRRPNTGSLRNISAVSWRFESNFTIEKRKPMCYNHIVAVGFFSF